VGFEDVGVGDAVGGAVVVVGLGVGGDVGVGVWGGEVGVMVGGGVGEGVKVGVGGGVGLPQSAGQLEVFSSSEG